jgi:hypothetical protein
MLFVAKAFGKKVQKYGIQLKSCSSKISSEMLVKQKSNFCAIYFMVAYDNNFTSIIDIYFYETFSAPNSNNKRLRFTL